MNTDKSELAVQEGPAEAPLVPVANVTELVEAMRRFEQVKAALLVKDQDTYTREGVERIRKSGWRKLALAFNISDEIVTENVTHDSADPAYLCVHTRVKAWARGGRTVEGVAAASSRERTFAHLEHDLHALAHTRAKSRAIADMLGSSDLVAEEEPEVLVQPAQTPAPASPVWSGPKIPALKPPQMAPPPTPPSSSPARTSHEKYPHGTRPGVVWEFLDEVLGEEIVDHITIESTADQVLVQLDHELVGVYGDAFKTALFTWGYRVEQSPAGMTAVLKRPKG